MFVKSFSVLLLSSLGTASPWYRRLETRCLPILFFPQFIKPFDPYIGLKAGANFQSEMQIFFQACLSDKQKTIPRYALLHAT